MTTYYLYEPSLADEVEITKDEWLAIIGDENHSIYAEKVYRGMINIDDVPEDKSKTVSDIVNNKIARWGVYEKEEEKATEADYIAALSEIGVIE